MLWTIAIGVACIFTAIYLLIVERQSQQQYKYRRSVGRQKYALALPGATVSAAAKMIVVFIGQMLYGLYVVLQFIVTKFAAMIQQAILRTRRWRRARAERKRIAQQTQSEENEDALTEETIRRIRQHGLLRYLKGK